jgi:exosortase A
MRDLPLSFGVPPHWRRALVALVAVLTVILFAYRHTVTSMVGIWSVSDTYAHGFVVPFISLWLVWRIRHSLADYQPRPSPSAWALMLGVAGLWLAGDLVEVNAVTHLSLALLVILAFPAILGWQVASAMAFPLGFLLFAVPIGDFMLPQLMEWTADFTVWALRATGIPVYREGLQFIIPSGSWSVVEACSGIRYMIASVTVGCLFAYMSYNSMAKRVAFIGVAIMVPLIANWLRAYMIVMIGHLSGNELATGVDHLVYGWVFFGVVILIMLFIGARWADPVVSTTSTPGLSFAGATGTQPVVALLPLAVVAVMGIAASPHLLERWFSSSINPDTVSLVAPIATAPWAITESPPSDWEPAFKNPSTTLHTGYVGPDGQTVGLHLSYYRAQDNDRKLVTSVNTLVTSNDQQWAQVLSGSATAQVDGQPLGVVSATLRHQAGGLGSSARRLQVWRFYWINDQFTASDVMAKLQGALSLVTGNGDDGAIVVVYTPFDSRLNQADASAAASAVLASFLQSQGTSVEAALQATREAR